MDKCEQRKMRRRNRRTVRWLARHKHVWIDHPGHGALVGPYRYCAKCWVVER